MVAGVAVETAVATAGEGLAGSGAGTGAFLIRVNLGREGLGSGGMADAS